MALCCDAGSFNTSTFKFDDALVATSSSRAPVAEDVPRDLFCDCGTSLGPRSSRLMTTTVVLRPDSDCCMFSNMAMALLTGLRASLASVTSESLELTRVLLLFVAELALFWRNNPGARANTELLSSSSSLSSCADCTSLCCCAMTSLLNGGCVMTRFGLAAGATRPTFDVVSSDALASLTRRDVDDDVSVSCDTSRDICFSSLSLTS